MSTADGNSESTPLGRLADRLSRALQNPVTRREVVKVGVVAGVTLAVSSGLAVPKFIQLSSDLESARTNLEATNKNVGELKNAVQAADRKTAQLSTDLAVADRATDFAKSRQATSESETRKFLEGESKIYVRDFTQTQLFANELVTRHLNYQSQKDKKWSEIDENALKIAFESSWSILERGVSLVTAWNRLEGGSENVGFDKAGRLILEGNKFLVNENVADYHLALNILLAKITIKSNSEKNGVVERAKEDLSDLKLLTDIRPAMSIEKTAWAIMPPEWACTLARYTKFLHERNIPPPQEYRMGREYTRDGKQVNGGGFYKSARGKFPSENQFIQLGSTSRPIIIWHEGGHYIADARKVTGRLFGGDNRTPLSDFQREYDSMLGRMQRSQLKIAKAEAKDLGSWETWGVVSPYGSTNTREDFAETFSAFMDYGPAFKEWIVKVRKTNPAGASMLEARYEFMRTNVAQGTEYGFRGRNIKVTPEIDSKVEVRRIVDDESFYLPARLKNASTSTGEFSSRLVAFKDAKVRVVLPEADVDLSLALLEPGIWTDILRTGEVVDVSNVASVPHNEFEGKIKINIPLKSGGNKSVLLDTKSGQDISALASLIPEISSDILSQMTSNDLSSFTEDSLGYLRAIGVKPIHVAFSNVWRPSYPPDYIDRSGLYFARFQFDNGKWVQKPLDLKRTNIFIKSSNDKNEVRNSDMHTISLGEKDIIIALDWEGTVREIKAVGFGENI